MRYVWTPLFLVIFVTGALGTSPFAQKPLTWQEVRGRFEAANPSPRAGQIGMDESRAEETTAYLRPIPTLRCWRTRSIPFLAARRTDPLRSYCRPPR